MKLLRTLLVLAPVALGAQTVVGTKHDLSIGGFNKVFVAGTAQDQVCVYCHTPHNAGASTNGPLWNRAASAATYTMYPSGGTINNPIAATPGAQSMACLSCHDGTVAMFNLVNTYTGTITSAALNPARTGNINGSGMMTGLALVGPSLTNDHPIAIDHNPALDSGLVAVATVTGAGGLRLYGASNKVECASCHNVHSNQYGLFLRKSNAGSALCTTCHSK